MASDCEFILDSLRAMADPFYRDKMLNFGIDNNKALGVSIPKVRALGKTIGVDQSLSLQLWDTQVHEARILASIVGDYRDVTSSQMDKWTNDFNSWDICDQACSNLFVHTPFYKEKILIYTNNEKEFVKRAGFVLMAAAAVHLKKEPDQTFLGFLPLIQKGSTDTRNFVKKAVNWALRQIGKRNLKLHKHAIETANHILALGNKKSNWVALDALRELKSESLKQRLNK